MSNLASTYLRQARGALRTHEPHRAIELLERARVLASADPELLAMILQDLADACELVGRRDAAANYREQFEAMRPAAPPSFDPPMPSAAVAQAPYIEPPRARSQTLAIAIPAATAALVLLTFGIWFLWFRTPAQPIGGTTPIPATQPSPPQPTPPAPAPTPQPAPQTQPTETKTTAPGMASRETLLRNNVGFVVMMAHYAGVVNGKRITLDFDIGTGTAFAIRGDGIMVTNRHVVQSRALPADLSTLELPSLKLLRTSPVVCFGPRPSEQLAAEIIKVSDKLDLAVLRVPRVFPNPLPLADKAPHQGDDVFVCGFPGVVNDFFNETADTPDRAKEIAAKLRQSGKFSALRDTYSIEVFNSTLTRGIVSAPERKFDGTRYVQVDARIAPGNSGGPVMDVNSKVIGMATFILTKREGYNFAISADEIRSEIREFISPE